MVDHLKHSIAYKFYFITVSLSSKTRWRQDEEIMIKWEKIKSHKDMNSYIEKYKTNWKIIRNNKNPWVCWK